MFYTCFLSRTYQSKCFSNQIIICKETHWGPYNGVVAIVFCNKSCIYVYMTELFNVIQSMTIVQDSSVIISHMHIFFYFCQGQTSNNVY